MQNWRRHSIFWPLMLITAGLLLLANNLGGLPGTTWDAVARLWPVILIASGIDGYWRGEGYVSATLVAGVGMLFLLSNLGYATVDGWMIILRLWPLLLLAIGLDLLIGRRWTWSAPLAILAGLALTAVVFWVVANPAFAGQAAVTRPIQLARSGAVSADGVIELPFGRLDLAAGAEGDVLLSGEMAGLSPENVTDSVTLENGVAIFKLQGHGVSGYLPFTNRTGQETWRLRLNPAVTYALDISRPVGDSRIDLTGLTLSRLSVGSPIGKTTLILPKEGVFTATIDAAVGLTEIYVPRGASVRIEFNRALTSTTQPGDFVVEGGTVRSPAYAAGSGIDLTVNAAVGAIHVRYLP